MGKPSPRRSVLKAVALCALQLPVLFFVTSTPTPTPTPTPTSTPTPTPILPSNPHRLTPPATIPLSALVRPDSYLFTVPAIANVHGHRIVLHLTARASGPATAHLCTDAWAPDTTTVLRPSAPASWDITHLVGPRPLRIAIVTPTTDRRAAIRVSIGQP